MAANMLWSKFKIQEVDATKVYFRKYHYKLEICTYLASYLRNRSNVLDRQHVNDFVSRFRQITYNYGGSWAFHRQYPSSVGASNGTDVDEIIEIGTILRKYPDIKYTIEDAGIRIFSDSEELLFSIATQVQHQTGRLGFYAAIWKPAVELKDKIDDGYEILTRDPGYTHKVVLRDRMIGTDVKHQIYNYLLSLGEDVRVTKGVSNILQGNSSYIYSCWFRTNDISLTAFLELISPGIVQKIVPVYVKNK
jgi:hypothetical protein